VTVTLCFGRNGSTIHQQSVEQKYNDCDCSVALTWLTC